MPYEAPTATIGIIDQSLSGTGSLACSTCHVDLYAAMNATFADPYPHWVKMAEAQVGQQQVTAAEMVQLCMVFAMRTRSLSIGIRLNWRRSLRT